MIEAIAYSLGIGISVWSISNAISSVYGKKHCNSHEKIIGILFSDIATIKSNFILLSAYVTRRADEEGINLNDSIIKSMMKKG